MSGSVDWATEALCAQVGGDMWHMDLEGVGTQRATLDHTRQTQEVTA